MARRFLQRRNEISIHTPREGSDSPSISEIARFCDFNPHSPRGERLVSRRPLLLSGGFQSTLPARGATGIWILNRKADNISIHTPREGSDRSTRRSLWVTWKFQSTLPARGATLPTKAQERFYTHFNPHSPRGERLIMDLCKRGGYKFQSTLPARGATFIATLVEQLNIISIHTPREGSDKLHVSSPFLRSYFNPHSPRGERPMELPSLSGTGYFNPHSPRGERLSGFSL